MKIDLHFPMALKQKQAQCSILSLKQTNSTYQSFKNGLCLECSQTSGFIWYDLYFIYFISNLLYVYSQQCLQLGETKHMTEANNSIMSLVFGTSIRSPSGGSVSVKRKHFTSPLILFYCGNHPIYFKTLSVPSVARGKIEQNFPHFCFVKMLKTNSTI